MVAKPVPERFLRAFSSPEKLKGALSQQRFVDGETSAFMVIGRRGHADRAVRPTTVEGGERAGRS